jgi:hypothetical protein
MANKYKVEQTSRNVLTVKFTRIAVGWEQWVMLRSDAHEDSPYCNRDLEEAHLSKAVSRNALVIDAGDLFCAMQGKYDPRSSMDDIRSEDVGEAYLDLIVEHAAERYEPYAKNFLLLGHGNHETSIRKRHGVDLTSNLVHRLNSMGGSCHLGFYGGYVRFQFVIQQTRRTSRNLKYYHGKRGGTSAPVTRGTIDTNRQSVYLPDADVVLNGHNHNEYILAIARERLTRVGIVKRDLIRFVRTPGYKDEYADGARGFGVEQGGGPKPLGCAWMKFYLKSTHNSDVGIELTADVE